jgi:phytoene/squalene synthetase
MHVSLQQTGIDAAHCHALLDAFRQDAVKRRYADWSELMGYCQLSAAPVGRYLLDLHGESQDSWPASDALCAALQVINHLQDCADDYRRLDRVYVPEDWLAAEQATASDLAAPACSPGLRRTLDRVVAATEPLVASAGRLPPGIKDRGLRTEAAVIVALAERLLARLARQDPLARRVKLGPLGMSWAALTGLLRAVAGGCP